MRTLVTILTLTIEGVLPEEFIVYILHAEYLYDSLKGHSV